MDDDDRPDDNSGEEESDAGWYFDLPNGAWERQEAKNRELRQSVRRNADAEPPKRQAFGRDDGRDLRQDEEPPSWRTLRGNASDDDEEDARPRWTLPTDSDPEPEAEAPPEYSAEPERPADLPPLRLRSRRVPDEDEIPALKPPPGLFSDESSPWSADPADEDVPAPRPNRFASPAEEEEPEPFVRGDQPPASADPARPSRWGEIFGEKASDGASMLEGMRAWAKSTDDASEGPAAGEEPVVQDEPAAPAPSAAQPVPDEPAPIPLRIQRHADDEPPIVNTANPESRWDQMFGRTAAEDSGLLEGMRAWATKHDDEEERPRPRMRLPDEGEEVDENLFQPFAWEQPAAGSGDVRDESARHEPDDHADKPGLLGKIFGKKKKTSETLPPASPVAADAGWAVDEDAPAGFPSRLSFGDLDEPERGGSWLGRSDGGENRFGSLDDGAGAWAPSTELPPADSPWKLDDQDQARPASRNFDPPDEPEWAPEPAPAPADEPATATAAPGWDLRRNNEDHAETEWDPDAPADGWQPVTPAGAWEPLAASEPASTGTGWNPEPGGSRFDSTSGAESEAAEGPWDPLDQAEREEPVAGGEPPIAAGGADLLAAANDGGSGSDPDDPWAAFIASRETGQPAAASAPAWTEVHHEPAATPPEDHHTELDATAGEDEPQDEPEEQAPWAPIAASAAGLAAVSARQSDEFDDAVDVASAEKRTAGEEFEAPDDSAFARVHDSQLEDEGDESGEETPGADDPWAAIAEASGVEPGSSEIAIFRPSAEVEDALNRYEAEREAEEAEAAIEPAAFPAAVDADDGPRAERPAWDDSEVEDDTVLRAFERHASLYDDDTDLAGMPAGSDTEPVVFDELLGEGADEIVAEASQPSPEARYLGRIHGWAPQRTPSGRQVFPWEADADDRERQQAQGPSDDDEGSVLEGWSRVEEPPPPWETAAAGGHGEAPSQRRKSRSRMLVREIVETGLLALLVFLAVRASFQNFKVDGLSMSPTLEDGEYLIVNKLAYAEVDMDRLGNFVPFVEAGDDPTREVFGGPERGDIVVLQDPRDEDTDLIKRIIGLPGETLEIVDGTVYINDFKLVEPYIKQEWSGDKEKVLIPEGYYFVMGDNRSNSKDSRSDDLGLISKDLIIGKAALTYWPSSKFGLAPNESGDISEKDGRPEITTQRLED